MRGEEDAAQLQRRLEELAARAFRTGRPCYTGFLSPAEAEWAFAASRRQKVNVSFEGGYEDAERRIACFWDDEEPYDYPFTAPATTPSTMYRCRKMKQMTLGKMASTIAARA